MTIFWALSNNSYINKEAASHKDSCTFWEEMCSTITSNTGYPTPKWYLSSYCFNISAKYICPFMVLKM